MSTPSEQHMHYHDQRNRPQPSAAWTRPSLSFAVLLILLALCALGGGSSYTDTTSLLYLRPAALVAAAFFLFQIRSFGEYRFPLLLLCGLAILMALQLVPLPPELWTAFPGRERYLEAAQAAGLPQPWRPLSLSPDATWNSLISLLIPGAALLGVAAMEPREREYLVPVLIALVLISVFVGLLQAAGGRDSLLYTYRRFHEGLPIGLFANRNHQAALLAMGFPALSVWAANASAGRDRVRVRTAIAACLGILLIPAILVTGSRSGMVLALIGIVAAWLVRPARRAPLRKRLLVPALGLGMLIAIIAVTLYFDRGVSIARLTEHNGLEGEARLRIIPISIEILRTFFPVGAGFGSFDPLYRGFESAEDILPSFANRAHSDSVELLIEGGLPALLLLLAFIAWVAISAWRLRHSASHSRAALTLGRLGLAIIVILLAASTSDYPLRTPLMAALLAIACGFLCHARGTKPARGRTRRG